MELPRPGPPAPSTPPPLVRLLLGLFGLVTAVPVVSVLGQDVLTSFYGVGPVDPAAEVLLQHRGVLQLVLGVAVVVAALRPAWLLPVATGASVTKGSFVALVLADAGARERLGLVSVVFDLLAVAFLAGAAWRWGRPARRA